MMILGVGAVLSLWVLGIKLRLCVTSAFTMKSSHQPVTKSVEVQNAYHFTTCVCEYGL